jgi:hypothetical protein
MNGKLVSTIETTEILDVHIAEGGGKEHNLFDLFQNIVLSCDQRETSSNELRVFVERSRHKSLSWTEPRSKVVWRFSVVLWFLCVDC